MMNFVYFFYLLKIFFTHMGIFDTYDEVIENIQQIPLDVYILDKRNKRIEKKYVKIKNKIDILTKKALKGQQIDENEIMKLQYKFKKYKKKYDKSILKFNDVIAPIISKTKQIISKNCFDIVIPNVNLENINRIVKVGKNKSFGNKYCTCRQYACENMIACEEPSCKIQWFHFDCVGITLPPKNLWYCADCRKQKLV